jgi:hypothetical protein
MVDWLRPHGEPLDKLLRKPQSFVLNYERSQRRIDMLELLRIADAMKADPRKVFMEIVTGQSGPKRRSG